ncbi:porin family protein [Spirosoma pulveris]
MKNLFPLLALAVLPFSLSAQTKSATRKPASSAHQPVIRSSASRLSTRPASTNGPQRAKQDEATSAAQSAPSKPAAEPVVSAGAPVSVPASAPTQQPAVAASTKSVAPARTTKPAPESREQALAGRSNQSRFRVGLRLGANGSTASSIDVSDFGNASVEPVTGFHAGMVFSIGKRAFTIQPEVMYSQYGFKIASGSDYLQLKTNTIEVPVLLKYSFGQGSARFFVNAGPTATYLLGGKLSYKEDGESGETDMEVGANDGRLNFGGSLGLGLSLKVGTGSFNIEARGTYLTTNTPDVAIQNGKLSVAYLIPLGGR